MLPGEVFFMAQGIDDKPALWRRAMLVVRQRPAMGVVVAIIAGLLLGAAATGVLMAGRMGAEPDGGVALGGSVGVESDRHAADGSGSDGAGGAGAADDEDDDGPSAGDKASSPDEASSRSGRGDAGEPAAQVVVDVAGAVARPGVVTLDDGARVEDALAAAGGVIDGADLRGVNRAARLSDGQRVYVPLDGEATPAISDPFGGAGSGLDAGGGSALDAPQLVNINSAGADELDALPGVGPATARAIVEDREANGPFAMPEDLMRVSGIGEKKFAKLKSSICV